MVLPVTALGKPGAANAQTLPPLPLPSRLTPTVPFLHSPLLSFMKAQNQIFFSHKAHTLNIFQLLGDTTF